MDVSGLDGTDHFKTGRAVTTEDLKRAYDTAEINPQKGDMVCLNTGWGRYFMSNNEKYLAGEPGLDIIAARWLTQ
ncbi:MAG: cyclase family protein [Thalassobaculaceae bacterium]